MWKKYESKPVTRTAHQVTEENNVYKKIDEQTSSIFIDGELVEFKHYEPVSVGDFIVRLTVEDTYHCTKAVFEERNII